MMMMILLLTVEALASQASPSPATAASQAAVPNEIVVTAKRDKCFMEYAKHQISPQEFKALAATWALGSPVRVIEPRGASIKCKFHIMTLLNKHGQHLAQFVPQVEDTSNASIDSSPNDNAPLAEPLSPRR